MSRLAWIADLLLGRRCRDCSVRVYPKDHCAHRYVCGRKEER